MLRFAEDIPVALENENDLPNILERKNKIMKNEFNLKINKKKTNILIYSRKEEDWLGTPTIRIEN